MGIHQTVVKLFVMCGRDSCRILKKSINVIVSHCKPLFGSSSDDDDDSGVSL